MPEVAKRKYKVASPIRVGGRHYPVGASIELTEGEAAQHGMKGRLLNAGASSAAASISKKQVDELQARVQDDLAAAQKLRDEAAADRVAAENALADATVARDDAQKLADQASADRTAAEAALAEAKALKAPAKDEKAAEKK